MHILIHHDQTAYAKNCFVGESIRIVDDILEYASDNDISSVLFSADFEKAFDPIDYLFLFAVSEKFGVGPNFIHWIRTLYDGAESSVMNNGHSTGYLPLEGPVKGILFQLIFSFLL